MKNWLRVTICVVLIVSVLAMSLSVFAVEETPEPTENPYNPNNNPLLENQLDDIGFLIWQLLQSWGINITFQDVSEYTAPIEDQIMNWVFEFLDEQPSVESVLAWVADWWFGIDFWGNLITNDTLLDDVQDFADWLIDKYDLTDNQVHYLNPSYQIQGYAFYEMNTFYEAEYHTGASWGDYVAISSDNFEGGQTYGYTVCMIPDNAKAGGYKYVVVFFSDNNASRVITQMRVNTAGVSSQYGVTSILQPRWALNQNGWYYVIQELLHYDSQLGYYYPKGRKFIGSQEDVEEFIDSADIVMVGDTKIVTDTINTPSVDEYYTPGDGIVIIDGEPNYQPVAVPNNIDVNNLPAVVSTRTIENPHLEEAYRPIQGLITYAKDGVEVCTALLYELPDELVYLWYGLIASIIIWGMIKLMREH